MADWEKGEVAITGGGPAGATAAYLLAKAGFRVDLFEKKTLPRPKPCAGLLTWKTLALVDTIFGESLQRLKTSGILIHTCRDYRVFFKDRQIGHGRLDFPFHFVQRAEYDQHWLKAARQAGALIHEGEAVVAVDSERRRVKTDRGRRLQAKAIIGADGALSLTRRTCFGRPVKTRWRRNLALTLEAHDPCGGRNQRQDCASLHFGYVPWGYAWSFPKKHYQTIGMVSLRRKDNRHFKDRFMQLWGALGQSPNRIPRLQSHPLPYGNYFRRPSRNRILLVGDACGLADPFLGEGIYYAHRSAQLAVRAIRSTWPGLDSLDNQYHRLLNRHVLRELRWIRLYRDLLFWGGSRRTFRGLRLVLDLFPKKLEAAVQGQLPFSHLLIPGFPSDPMI